MRYRSLQGDVVEPGPSGGSEDGRAVGAEVGVSQDGVVEQPTELLARMWAWVVGQAALSALAEAMTWGTSVRIFIAACQPLNPLQPARRGRG